MIIQKSATIIIVDFKPTKIPLRICVAVVLAISTYILSGKADFTGSKRGSWAADIYSRGPPTCDYLCRRPPKNPP